MLSVEVLVARMQPGFATASIAANTCFFSARLSNTASITRSAAATPSYPVASRIRPIRRSASSGVKRPRLTDDS